MKRFLLVFMAVNLLSTFAVWGGGQQGGGAQSKGSTTIRVLVAGNVQSFLPGEDENNNEIHAWLEKFSGYKLDYTILPADAQAAKQRLTLEFASGNPADMIVPGNFHELAAAGYLMDVTDYVANNAMIQKTKVMDPEVYAMGVVNKKLYGIPMPTNGSPEPDSMAGMKQFTGPAKIVKGDMSLNHVTDMLAAAKKAYPDKTILTGGGSLTADYILQGFKWLYGAFGVATPWRDTGGKLEYSAVTDDMKACLAYIADINARGYLDTEYAALNFERVREKMLNGRTVFSLMPWYQWQSISMWQDAGKNPIYELYGNAVGAGGRKGQDIGSPALSIIKIPKTCKIPEAVVDYVAHLCQPEAYDFIFFGEKDIDFKEENGLRINLGTNRRVSTGTNYSVYYYIYEDVPQRNMRLLYADPSPNNQYWITTYATELKTILNPAAAMPAIPEVIKYGSDVNDLCAQYFLKIATGALPVSAFDEFKARFDAIGGKEMVKAVNA
jgi:putative aldouronate transport system substrate-binding protein